MGAPVDKTQKTVISFIVFNAIIMIIFFVLAFVEIMRINQR